MRPHLLVLGLSAAIVSATALAGSTQTLQLTIPKVALVNIEPITSLTFVEGKNTASGTSSLSISSNDPQTKLEIIPTGISLAVTSSSIDCPTPSSTSTITCVIGIKRTKNGILAFDTTRTEGDNLSIAYTLTQ
ncbi:MAG: hypothetical protein RL122_2696 [Pseudomonadota bacterium]|jgi:hypothetical protein